MKILIKKVRFVFLIFVTFFFNLTNSYSTSLNEIDIAGIKYGESLILYADENLIKESIVAYPYKDKEYSTTRFILDGSGYDYVEISFKTDDTSYKITELTGFKLISDMNECETIKKQVQSQYSEIFKNIKPKIEKRNHPFDKTGNSKMSGSTYNFKGTQKGMAQLACIDWSKKLEKTYGDHFAFTVASTEMLKWKEKQYK